MRAIAIKCIPAILFWACPVTHAIELQSVLSGLSEPIYLTSAKDGTDRRFIVERFGAIKVLQPGSNTPTVFLNLSSKVRTSGGEQGLLGLAFHPQYAVNRRFFVNYTRSGDGATVIAEYHASVADPNVADTNETSILVIAQPFDNHNGGMIEFGPDGFLYIGMGDGGSAHDPGNRAQNINNLLGKMLRIDIDTPNGPVPYSSPASNPFFGGTPGADEIYAVGLRNPWRFSFDRGTGDLYAGDVGQDVWEEIDVIALGGNYGWRVYEGNHCTGLDGGLCNTNNYDFPVVEYQHLSGRCSVTGGYVYRGARSTLAVGAYVYADFCTGEIFLLNGGGQMLLTNTSIGVSSFGEDEAGEVYVVGLGGSVHRITASPPPAACSYSIAPTNSSFSESGGAGAATMTAGASCNWIAASHDTWITITSGTNGTGNGTINYTVDANPGAARTGTITAGGRTHTVNQSGPVGCTFTISPTNAAFGASGGSSNVTVTASATNCAWTAVSNSGFILVTLGAAGIGNGVVNYSVLANVGAARAGTITIAGKTFTVNQSSGCTFTISPTNAAFSAAGGNNSVTVTASGTNCAWTAVSNAGWIIVTSGAAGTGNGVVNYSVGANAGDPRIGTMTIAGKTFTVNQSSGCTFTIAPTNAAFSASGGNNSVTVTASGTNCAWTAVSNSGFIDVTSGTAGIGNGIVNYSVDPNVGAARSGTITIAGNTFTVNQGSGCTFTIAPTNATFGATGGSSNVAVTASSANCPWTAASNDGWISITSGAAGTGNGSVSYSVAANLGSPRSGTLTIAGKTFTVNQGSGCAFTIAPTNASFSASGGNSNVAVTASAGGCAWTAVSNDAWIIVTSGAAGTGNGSVNYSVAANVGDARSGTITIAGKTFTVNQSSGCAFSMSPTSAAFTASGGSSNVTVTASETNCARTAVSNNGWISVTAGAAGTGDGSVNYDVAPNPGTDPRTGTVTIAMHAFTVMQAGADSETDLAIAKAGSPDPVGAGSNLTYTITVTNIGPLAATGVTVSDPLLAGLSFVSATPSQGVCSNPGGVVHCELGSLSVGAIATVTLVVTPQAAGSVNNTATVAAIEPDPNPANNSATALTTVNPVGNHPPIELQEVATGLSSPLYVTSARDGTDRLFIVEQTGAIHVLEPGSNMPTEFLNIASRIVAGGHQGLLGLAFHPQYALNRRFFVNYTRMGDGATVIAEYHALAADPNVADTDEIVVLVIPHPSAKNNGGMMEFDSEGHLFISVGDGGLLDDPGNRAQNINDLHGKLLRIDIDHPNGPAPYSSPSDNPFFGATDGSDEIYALGFRHPWRFSFDRDTDDLRVGDVGEQMREEIDLVALGGNYGWRVFEGSVCTDNDPGLCDPGNFIGPIAEYGTHLGGRCSITGGYVYRGARSTLPTGSYVFGDFCTGEILLLEGIVQTLMLDTDLLISSFGEDEAGEVYAVDIAGSVQRIVSSPPPAPCLYSISPTNEMFSPAGEAGNVTMTTSDDCNWLAARHDEWITLTSASEGTGSGPVAYSVAANTGPARTGTITLGGQTLTVMQDAVPPGSTDVAVSKTDSPNPVTAGSNLTYTVSVTNNGPLTATAVTMIDALPSSVDFVSATPSQGDCSNDLGVVTCDFGDLADGAVATVAIVVTPQVVGFLTNTSTAAAAEADSFPANNTASQVTRVASMLDGATIEADFTLPVQKCKIKKGVTTCKVQTRFTCINTGPAEVSSIHVRFFLSANETFEEGDDALLLGTDTGAIDPGKSFKQKLKQSLAASASGQFLLAVDDSGGVIAAEPIP